MKHILITGIILAAVSFSSVAQQVNTQYDSTLARKLGADDYGMKYYTFVILKSGPTDIEDKSRRDSIFKGHLENINRLAQNGKLIVAGPFGNNSLTYRGLFILDMEDKDEVEKILQSDPAIKAGVFETEIISWYGSAALPTYLETHEKIEKKKP